MEANLLSLLRQELQKRGYREYARPHELNLVAIRKPSAQAGEYADELHVFYREGDGATTYAVLPCTTDPITWAGWARRPESKALRLLIEGQYPDALDVLHYPATMGGTRVLEQNGPMAFLEGYDRAAPFGLSVGKRVVHLPSRDGSLRFVPSTYQQVAGALDAGNPADRLARIQTWQILRNRRDYEWLLQVAGRHSAQYGPITYTLLDARTHRVELLRKVGRTVLLGAGLLGGLLGAFRSATLATNRQLPDGTGQ